MDNKESDNLLQQLHDAINSIQKVDKKGGELLRDLDGDIRLLLERSGEQPLQVQPPVFVRLESAISHFEATHPDLTDLLAKVMSSLSNAGV
jgi:Domain of unknown function (DUF4404)